MPLTQASHGRNEERPCERAAARSRRAKVFLFIFFATLFFFGFPIHAKKYVRPYDLIDARFCHLTPRPFICKRCLGRDEQFVQILSFEADGRPVRTYACRPYKRKYLH
jgi:hypothetical protein